MIRVMVLEDEKPIARNIASSIEREHKEFQVVHIVPNGKRALDILMEEPIDVLFLDINVPLVSGLEVLKYINQHKLDIISVVLSGYQEFDYAQTAMRNGAVDYLLKPLDKEVLKGVLDKCYHKIYKKKMEEQLHLDQKKMEQVIKEQEEKCIFGIFYIGSCVDAFLEAEEQELLDRVEREFIIILESKFERNMFWVVAGKTSHEKLLFIKEGEENYLQKLKDIFEALQLSIPVTLLITDKTIRMNQVLMTYKKQVHVLKNYIKFGESTFLSGGLEIKEKGTFNKEKELIQSIHQFSGKEQVLSVLREVLNEIDFMTRVEVSYLVKHFFLHLCKEYSLGREYLEIEAENIYVVDNSYTKEALYEHLEKLINMEFFPDEEGEQNANMIAESIKQYIDNNYREEFSNSILEEKMGYSQFYLRKIFKEYYGMLPNAYLSWKRMEKAKELLLLNMQVKDVAYEVGYMDPLYFSRAFKKAVGCSPKEFITGS